MVAIFDRYANGTGELQAMVQRMDPNAKIVVLSDTPFAPCGVLGLYDYFIYERNQEPHEEKKLHFNFLKVPDFWEIRTEGTHGAVYDMDRKKADIYFTKYPYLQRVEWRMEDGWIYKIDYYNKYALKYASEFLDRDWNVESKVFYSSRNQEVVVEQPQNDVVTLLEGGQVRAFFTSYAQFIEYFFQETGLEREQRILFVQDQTGLELAALQSGGKSMWECVLFTNSELLDRYVGKGGKNGYRFYVMPDEYPTNRARGEALILTASDQLEGIEYLIQELPEVTFHIAANTQVSEKLYRLGEQHNVKIYPQINMRDLNDLWDRCDFYLDINHYKEIHNAIDTAHKKNLLILGFENTVHCRELVDEAYIFSQAGKEKLVFAMKELVDHPALVQERLKGQQTRKHEIWKGLMDVLRRRVETA